VAKTKTLGIVKMNKMNWTNKFDKMGNEHPSFFKWNKNNIN
jgi:hypothetical protein